jgi:uncharacterized membrane protein
VVDGRLEAFSDGVFAVAITLLSIDLVVAGPGHGTTLAHQLREAWPNFAAFLVSFFVVGIIWVNHHSLFKNFAKVDRTLLFLNLLLLLFVVTIPFVTSTLAKYLTDNSRSASLAAVLYSGVSLAMSVSFALLFNWSVRDPSRLRNPVPSEQLKRIRFRFVGVGTSVYVVALIVGIFSAPVCLAVNALIAAYYCFEQTPPLTRTMPGPDVVPEE